MHAPAAESRPPDSGQELTEEFVDRRRTNMRAQIIQVATELFFHHGFEATTIRMITEACGITAGAFYNHFATKEDLLYEIVTTSIAHTERLMLGALSAAGDDPREKLKAAVREFVRFHAEHRLSGLVASAEYSSLPEPRLTEVKELRLRMRAMFEKIIASGQKSGQFRLAPAQGVSPVKLAAVAIGDMCIRVAEWFDPKGPLDMEHLAELYAQLSLRILGSPKD